MRKQIFYSVRLFFLSIFRRFNCDCSIAICHWNIMLLSRHFQQSIVSLFSSVPCLHQMKIKNGKFYLLLGCRSLSGFEIHSCLVQYRWCNTIFFDSLTCALFAFRFWKRIWTAVFFLGGSKVSRDHHPNWSNKVLAKLHYLWGKLYTNVYGGPHINKNAKRRVLGSPGNLVSCSTSTLETLQNLEIRYFS